MKYHFAHLLLHEGLKFNVNIVKILSNSTYVLSAKEHFFVTPYWDVYEAIREYNACYDPQAVFSLINKYAEMSDWVFVHDINKPIQLLLVKKKNLKKTVWRSWGSDAGYTYRGTNPIAQNGVNIINRIIKPRYQQFKAVGVANVVDEVDVERKIGSVPMVRLSYASAGGYQTLNDVRKIPKNNRDNLNVLIEHSGYDPDHIRIIKMLEKYKAKPIHLFVVLSYGRKEYIETVKKYVQENWKEKATVVTSFMAYREYAELLRQVDVAIFDLKGSYALGNIGMLVFFQAKFFLNKDGVLAEAFRRDRIPFQTTDSIEKMSFESFGEPLVYEDGAGENILPNQYEKSMKIWNDLFDYLDSEIKKTI